MSLLWLLVAIKFRQIQVHVVSGSQKLSLMSRSLVGIHVVTYLMLSVSQLYYEPINTSLGEFLPMGSSLPGEVISSLNSSKDWFLQALICPLIPWLGYFRSDWEAVYVFLDDIVFMNCIVYVSGVTSCLLFSLCKIVQSFWACSFFYCRYLWLSIFHQIIRSSTTCLEHFPIKQALSLLTGM